MILRSVLRSALLYAEMMMILRKLVLDVMKLQLTNHFYS